MSRFSGHLQRYEIPDQVGNDELIRVGNDELVEAGSDRRHARLDPTLCPDRPNVMPGSTQRHARLDRASHSRTSPAPHTVGRGTRDGPPPTKMAVFARGGPDGGPPRAVSLEWSVVLRLPAAERKQGGGVDSLSTADSHKPARRLPDGRCGELRERALLASAGCIEAERARPVTCW